VVGLPAYRVEGWPGPSGFAVSGISGAAFRAGDEFGEPVVLTRDVHHAHGRRSVTVTSSRPQGDALASAWQRIGVDGEAEPSWTPVTITVADRDQLFDLARLGSSWVAVAEGDDLRITITARNVDVADVRLVEIEPADLPPLRRSRRPRPRQRVLPAVFERATGAPAVELTYRNRKVITGTVGGSPVELAADLPVSSGSARGRLGGVPVSANWDTNAEPVTLTGALGDLAVTISGPFVQEDEGFFDFADVRGRVGPDDLEVRIERADGGLSTSTLYADGTIGAVSFALWATQGGDMRQTIVHGTVGGRPVELIGTRGDYAEHLQIRGNYAGPDALLLLIVGGTAYFS